MNKLLIIAAVLLMLQGCERTNAGGIDDITETKPDHPIKRTGKEHWSALHKYHKRVSDDDIGEPVTDINKDFELDELGSDYVSQPKKRGVKSQPRQLNEDDFLIEEVPVQRTEHQTERRGKRQPPKLDNIGDLGQYQ